MADNLKELEQFLGLTGQSSVIQTPPVPLLTQQPVVHTPVVVHAHGLQTPGVHTPGIQVPPRMPPQLHTPAQVQVKVQAPMVHTPAPALDRSKLAGQLMEQMQGSQGQGPLRLPQETGATNATGTNLARRMWSSVYVYVCICELMC
jgi:hypothetical protein